MDIKFYGLLITDNQDKLHLTFDGYSDFRSCCLMAYQAKFYLLPTFASQQNNSVMVNDTEHFQDLMDGMKKYSESRLKNEARINERKKQP